MADATAKRSGQTGGKNSTFKSKPLVLEQKLTGSVQDLLDSDEGVSRWHANLARSSQLTADSRIRRLNMFYKNTGVTPASMVETGKKDAIKAEDMILDYVTWMESQKYAPGYIEDVVKALKSWLSYNYVDIRRKIKVANARIPVTLDDEQVPTPAQLESIMNAADPRTRACMSLMAFAGVRPQVIGNHNGTDGLRISDVEGLRANDNEHAVSLERTPARITIRPQISKAGHRYFTFLTSQGGSYLLGYLRGRAAAGEEIKPDTPLICRKKTLNGKTTSTQNFVTTKSVTAPMRKAIRSVITARPYVLRAYFDTQLLVAEQRIHDARIPPVLYGSYGRHGGALYYKQGKADRSDDRGHAGSLLEARCFCAQATGMIQSTDKRHSCSRCGSRPERTGWIRPALECRWMAAIYQNHIQMTMQKRHLSVICQCKKARNRRKIFHTRPPIKPR